SPSPLSSGVKGPSSPKLDKLGKRDAIGTITSRPASKTSRNGRLWRLYQLSMNLARKLGTSTCTGQARAHALHERHSSRAWFTSLSNLGSAFPSGPPCRNHSRTRAERPFGELRRSFVAL